MKIAFYTSAILEHGGGLEQYYMETARELKKRNPSAQIDIITNSQKFSERLLSSLRFFYFKKINKNTLQKETEISIKKKIGSDVSYIKANSFQELVELLREYDVIYSKNELLEAFIFKFLLGYKKMPPVIFGCHTSLFYPSMRSLHDRVHNILYTGKLYKMMASGVAAFHAINSFDESKLKDIFPNKKIVKIFNPFDFKEFAKKADTYQHEFDFDNSRFNILWVGRLSKLKGFDDLVQIIECINQENESKVAWNIVGDGEELRGLEEFRKKYKNINYLGQVSREYLPSVYKENDLFISTSRVEVFGFTVAEALSFGLPVIVRPNNGAQEMIENERNGYLVNSVDEFVEKIVYLIDGNKLENDDSNKLLEKKLDKEKIYAELMSLVCST